LNEFEVEYLVVGGYAVDTGWRNRTPDSIFGVPVHFLSLNDLITNKRSTGHSTELEQVKDLEREAKKKG
jgi:hypothetical protein